MTKMRAPDYGVRRRQHAKTSDSVHGAASGIGGARVQHPTLINKREASVKVILIGTAGFNARLPRAAPPRDRPRLGPRSPGECPGNPEHVSGGSVQAADHLRMRSAGSHVLCINQASGKY